jgi:integrase
VEIFDFAAGAHRAPNDQMRNVGRTAAAFGGVRRPRDREHLTLSEVEAVIDAARKGRYGLRDSTLLLMLFSHGLRLTEALNLTFRHVDLDRGIVHIKRKKGGVDGDHKLRGREIRALRIPAREQASGRRFDLHVRARHPAYRKKRPAHD